ncbi:hypothetical protein [Marivita sp. GX14005]|uniref:hypothetical protein n=1 Tax=Marivita sp. GX14005 TaxID=2942276 RepID=UPI0020185481|nr:hypothetical protein [Marivita sp. GX14005]MCL3881026.1 hypothetical protein [Marivita sp. GX14005]
MNKTEHIDTRMNHRAIRGDLVALTMEIGDVEGDRIVLSSEAISAEEAELRHRLKLLADARKKGGVVVVAEGENLITTYRKSNFNANLIRNS